MPFGVQRSHSGANASDYKYTDQELDNESVLYNYDARMYDPVIGRFISGDTMVPDWYDPQSLNRYSYCLNNPLKYKDPNGHWALQVFGTVMGAGINALKNYDAVSSGAMTKGEYARSIAVGGGLGFLASCGNVDAVSILLGGAASAVNEIHEQTLNGKLVSEMDKGEIFKAGVDGALTSSIGEVTKIAGASILTYKTSINYLGIEVTESVVDHGNISGVLGEVAGTYFTQDKQQATNQKPTETGDKKSSDKTEDFKQEMEPSQVGGPIILHGRIIPPMP